MPNIQLTDNTTLNITASAADKNATLNRYLKNPLVFLAPGALQAVVDKTVADLDPTPFPLTATATGNGQFAVEGTTLGVQMGCSASLGLLTSDDKDDYLSSLRIPSTPAIAGLVSFAIEGTLSAGPTATVGDFSFGITNGATATVTNVYLAASADKFADAVKRAIVGLTIPHDIDDLKSLPANAICEIRGSSSLQFAASVTYSFLNDPLATASISKLPPIAINASAGATLEATATHTADHTVTMAKLPNGRVHLAVSVAKTDDLETSLTVSAGLTADLGTHDALAFLLQKISPNSTVEMSQVAKDMPPEQAARLSDDIKGAIDAALNNSFQVSLKEALDTSTCQGRLFLYEIDLEAIDLISTAALKSALAGDFTKLTKDGSALAGIRELDSAFTVTSKTTHRLTLHLLGIFNCGSTNEFISKCKADYTKDTREIVLSDETIQIDTNNLKADKLRQIALKGITLTLPASANTPEAKTPISMVYFERKAATDPATMRQFANVLRATGDSAATGASALLNQNLKSYGTSSLYLALKLTPAQCRQLFIDNNGKPFDWSHYLQNACNAEATILDGAEDTVSASRLKLFRAGQAFWNQLREQGAAPNQIRMLADAGIDQSAEVDVITLIWWSCAMSDYAKALAAGQPLDKVGRQVVKDSTLGFDEPWLILATREMLQNPAIEILFTSPTIKRATGVSG